jgi:hypothetical protein
MAAARISVSGQPPAFLRSPIQQQPTFPWWRVYEKLRLCRECALPGPVVGSFPRRLWWRECKPKAHAYANPNANTARRNTYAYARCGAWDICLRQQLFFCCFAADRLPAERGRNSHRTARFALHGCARIFFFFFLWAGSGISPDTAISILITATIQIMEAKLLHIPWLVSVLYSSIPLFWFAIHPFADFWRRMDRSPYFLLLPIWAAIILALGWATWPWHAVRLYSSPWMWAPAVLLMFFGLRTYGGIRSGFGAHKLSGEAELRPLEHQQELVTTGLHARMRHPIYIAHLLNLAGWTIGSGLLVSYILLAVSALSTFPLMIWIEENELEKRFGQRFRDYRARVPLVPLPFQRTSA